MLAAGAAPSTGEPEAVAIECETPVLYDDAEAATPPVTTRRSRYPTTPRADGGRGRYNYVDIAYGMSLGGQSVDVAVVSHRSNDQLLPLTTDACRVPSPSQGGHPVPLHIGLKGTRCATVR